MHLVVQSVLDTDLNWSISVKTLSPEGQCHCAVEVCDCVLLLTSRLSKLL